MAPTASPGPALPLVLTMGEPAGIGPDVTVAAWARRGDFRLPVFYCRADPKVLAERAKLLGGTLEAGPGPDRGWVVEAVLPQAGSAG